MSRALWHPKRFGIGQRNDLRFLRTALPARSFSKSPFAALFCAAVRPRPKGAYGARTQAALLRGSAFLTDGRDRRVFCI